MNRGSFTITGLGIALILVAAASVTAGVTFGTQATAATTSRTLTTPPSAAALEKISGPITLPTLDAVQVARGQVVYEQNCAKCHGAQLEGQPNWRYPSLITFKYPAPPHTDVGHTWQHADTELLDYIMNGTGGLSSEMVGFRGVLSGPDMAAVLAFIKSNWNPGTREYQYRITLIHHIWGATGH
jgi:mono/diheme cytochrome c family protein